MRLLLIRHGQTPNNVLGALDTAYPGAGLTDLGHLQADAVPDALADEQVSGIYASRLTRTQLTADPLSRTRGLDVLVLDGLEEVSAGDGEMSVESGAIRTYVDCVADWMAGDLGRRMPGAMTGHEFFARYQAAVLAIADRHRPHDSVAVFSHGAAIRAFTALAVGLGPDASAELRLMNTGMAVLTGHPIAGWELESWHSEPLGGPELLDERAHDVTGESTEEVAHEE